jgi:hypothetical protein
MVPEDLNAARPKIRRTLRNDNPLGKKILERASHPAFLLAGKGILGAGESNGLRRE